MNNKDNRLESLKRLLRPIRIRLGYILWLGKGKPSGEFYYKKMVLADIASRYRCSSFVETGTGWGFMLDAMRKRFNSVYSVEIHPPLFQQAQKKFSKRKNVFLFHGDSKFVLEEILVQTSGRILFWLDGHYSGPLTGRGDTDCPLLEDLKVIAKNPRKDHCILIDDSRHFGTEKDYPRLEEVTAALLRINHRYLINVEGDIIRALPQS